MKTSIALLAAIALPGCMTDDGTGDPTEIALAIGAPCEPDELLVTTDNSPLNFVVPPGCTQLDIKAWGAGGSRGYVSGSPDCGGVTGSSGNGGGGAFVERHLTVEPGRWLQITAGRTGDLRYGGGYSSVRDVFDYNLVAAGGGGGGCHMLPGQYAHGGAGGPDGEPGDDARSSLYPNPSTGGLAGGGGGASRGTGGAAGSSTAGRPGQIGRHLQDGRGNSAEGLDLGGKSVGGGYGGGGWYGGGGGGTIYYAGAGGGGGGSWLGRGITVARSSGGSGSSPGAVTDPDRDHAGEGGKVGSAATPGRVVIRWGEHVEIDAPRFINPEEWILATTVYIPNMYYEWSISSSVGLVETQPGVAPNMHLFKADGWGAKVTLVVRLRDATGARVYAGRRVVTTHYGDQPVLFASFIETVTALDVMRGCGNGNFCPGAPMTRGTMPEALLVALQGGDYYPPPARGTFVDVPATDPIAPWVEELNRRGITGGCAPAPPGGKPSYCPDQPVTRAQSAVLLLSTLMGPGWTPTMPYEGMFADVPATSPFALWIEELARQGITGGCRTTPSGQKDFCPGDAVSRGQMAVFLVTTFELALPE